jgi:hypothetical protein
MKEAWRTNGLKQSFSGFCTDIFRQLVEAFSVNQ